MLHFTGVNLLKCTANKDSKRLTQNLNFSEHLVS